MESFSIIKGEGRCRIILTVTLTVEGISVLITGGEKSHIGGMVLCLPRPSLAGEGTGVDTWVVPVPGHKDVLLAEPAGALISKALGEAVAVTAGIHSERATREEIQALTANCLEAAGLAAEKCRRLRGQK